MTRTSRKPSECFKLKESKRDRPDVACQIDDQHQKQQDLRRTGLIAHLDTMKTLLRQGLAIRGH